MWFVTNLSINKHSIEGAVIMFINIRVLRLCSKDWKSSLSDIMTFLAAFYRLVFLVFNFRQYYSLVMVLICMPLFL